MYPATLLDEMLLFAQGGSGFNRAGSGLETGLGGALLLELALAERIVLAAGRVRVADPTPLGHPLLDQGLAQLTSDKQRKPKDAIQRLSKGRVRQTRAHLTACGALQARREKFLGVIPYSRLQLADSSIADDARARLRAAVHAGRAQDARTAALASLVYAVRMEKLALPELKPSRTRRVLKAVSQGSWAGEATRKAVEEVQAALMIAVVTAGGAAAAAAGS